MPGYADRLLHFEFPDLTPPGDPMVFVDFRNPRLVPLSILQGGDVAIDPTSGLPVDPQQAVAAMYESIAVLIKGWRVFDGMDDADDPEPLPLPATPALVEKLPAAIINRIGQEVNAAVNPH